MPQILLIRPRIGFGIGGAEYHAGMVAVKLIEKGFKIGIIANEISFPPHLKEKIEFFPVKLKGFGSLPKQILFILQVKKILTQLKSKFENPRVISFFRIPYEADLFILCDPLFAFLVYQKKPLFSQIRPRYQTLLYLEKKALEKAKKVISLFKLGKDLIERFYPFASRKTFICHRGMDLSRFNPKLKKEKISLRKAFGFSESDYLLLFVGYDTKRKGLDLLLKVLPYLPQRIKLIIAGKEGKSSERVIYLGKVKEVEKLYALSDLFVLPTLYDPGALATLEALASGTPVITTPFDGTSEFVKEGINGFVVERTPEALKEAILKAMETPFKPEVIASSVKNLTWDNYVDCLLSHLEL